MNTALRIQLREQRRLRFDLFWNDLLAVLSVLVAVGIVVRLVTEW